MSHRKALLDYALLLLLAFVVVGISNLGGAPGPPGGLQANLLGGRGASTPPQPRALMVEGDGGLLVATTEGLWRYTQGRLERLRGEPLTSLAPGPIVAGPTVGIEAWQGGRWLPLQPASGQALVARAGGELMAYLPPRGLFAWAGDRWRWVGEPPLAAFRSLAAKGSRLYLGGPQGLQRSENGGAAWTRVGPPDLHIFALALPPEGELLYAATDRGLLKSVDGGQTFQRLDRAPVGIVAVTCQGADTLFAATADFRLYESRDGGRSWRALGMNPASSHKNAS